MLRSPCYPAVLCHSSCVPSDQPGGLGRYRVASFAQSIPLDGGGPASHAAIVAREYGIPAVIGTGTGTRTLTDGQLVTVDGSTGRVTGALAEHDNHPTG